MLRQGIYIPGVILTYFFTTLEPSIFFSLFDEKNKDSYYLFRKEIMKRILTLPSLRSLVHQ